MHFWTRRRQSYFIGPILVEIDSLYPSVALSQSQFECKIINYPYLAFAAVINFGRQRKVQSSAYKIRKDSKKFRSLKRFCRSRILI